MTGATTSGELRSHNLVRVLRAVHYDGAERTRSELTRGLGLARGTATVLVAELVRDRLLAERPAERPVRGRPTGIPGPHPEGPIVLAVDYHEDYWCIGTAELGGRITVLETNPHGVAEPARELTILAEAIERHRSPRVVGIGVALPGPIRSGTLLDVSHLGWQDVPAAELLPATARLGNDARLAGVAEAHRGALRGAGVGLHLYVDFDIGGTMIVDGRPLAGAHGTGGEFGHMPLTGGTGRCTCGATGCWGLDVGWNALLRRIGGRIVPGHGREEARRILTRAAAGDGEARTAIESCATAFGRGIAALVNAHDPDVVSVSGLGADLSDQCGDLLHAAYLDGLMAFRRSAPPPITPSRLGARAPLIGAAELAFDAFLTPDGIRSWRGGAADDH